MAHFIFVKHRREELFGSLNANKEKLKKNILPKSLNESDVICNSDSNKREELLILNPSKSLISSGTSILGGSLFQIDQQVFTIDSKTPNSFTFLVKSSKQKVVTNTGILASRTIWYYYDEKQLIVSSSQRAITALIGRFSLNEQALSWFISTGMTGPENSWNSEVKWLGPAAHLELDNEKWDLTYTQNTTSFKENDLTKVEKNELLDREFSEIFSNISVNNKSFVTLSGGADSRLVASLIKKYNDFDIDTVTWGDKDKSNLKHGDIRIAKSVAESLNLDNTFFDIDPIRNDNNTLESFFENFVRTGEGRIDHFDGYLDNFKLWGELSGKYDTVIRGDEVFGWLPVVEESDLRVLLSYHEIGIYRNMKSLKEYGLPKINFPESLERTDGESLPQWRDRLFNYHNVSTKQASLQDLKYPFVETLNPLIHKTIVELTRTFNDSERTNKALYLETIQKHMPNLPFAETSTMPSIEILLRKSENLEFFQDTLHSQKIKNLVGSKILSEVNNFNISLEKKSLSVNDLKSYLNKLLPSSVKKYIKKNVNVHYLPKEKLALRLVMLSVIMEQYEQDKSFLKS